MPSGHACGSPGIGSAVDVETGALSFHLTLPVYAIVDTTCPACISVRIPSEAHLEQFARMLSEMVKAVDEGRASTPGTMAIPMDPARERRGRPRKGSR